MITSKIESILQGYPLTDDQRSQLCQELTQVWCEAQLEALSAFEVGISQAFEKVRRELHPDRTLADKSIRDLQKLAREKEIPYRNLTKPELVRAIVTHST